MKRKDLLGLDGVSREEITEILDNAMMMRQIVRSNNKKTAHLQGKSIVDVGTGAGFPGIPLAVALPESHVTLLDSLNKRIGFLHEV